MTTETKVTPGQKAVATRRKRQAQRDLLTAAPDMLEALEDFVALNVAAANGSPFGQARVRAKAAIAKARGDA